MRCEEGFSGSWDFLVSSCYASSMQCNSFTASALSIHVNLQGLLLILYPWLWLAYRNSALICLPVKNFDPVGFGYAAFGEHKQSQT
jgi:hypothetical protein